MNEPRTYLDWLYVLTAATCALILAYQGWRRLPDARQMANE